MKILYAIQATGNGHIARAKQILPILNKYANVDIFLSGNNANLALDNVKYRSKGLSFFYSKKGGLNYFKTIRQVQPIRLLTEINQLPVDDYNFVINDFEAISAWACYFKNIPCVSFGHQAAFNSSYTPRPERQSQLGEKILKHYAPSHTSVGLHFKKYDDFISTPIIKKSLYECSPQNFGHITVYLSAFSEDEILKWAQHIKHFRWEIFSKNCKSITQKGNVTIFPTNDELFTQSMINSHAVITGAGFETPAEALFLGKKLLVIPIAGQYEQLCNAQALIEMGISCINDKTNIQLQIENWLNNANTIKMDYTNNTEILIEKIFELSREIIPTKFDSLSLIR